MLRQKNDKMLRQKNAKILRQKNDKMLRQKIMTKRLFCSVIKALELPLFDVIFFIVATVFLWNTYIIILYWQSHSYLMKDAVQPLFNRLNPIGSLMLFPSLSYGYRRYYPPIVTGEVYCFLRRQLIFSFDWRVIYHWKGVWEYIPKSVCTTIFKKIAELCFYPKSLMYVNGFDSTSCTNYWN